MANRFTDPRPQFLDSSGRVLNGGKLYFYLTGSSTPATTYSDRTLTTPNSNPVVLLSDGRPATDIFLDPAVTYKVVLTNATGSTTFWTADPVVDPAAGVTAVIQVYNGNPNGHVAGNAGSVGGSGASMVYDITNEVLYVCITTGTAGTAVWAAVNGVLSETFDADGTWTKPAGIKTASRVFVQMWGGGGGGGANASGGGGGGGGYAEAWFAASAIGATVAVTVAPAGAVSGNGGSSFFGSYMSVGGGGAGQNGANGGGGGGGGPGGYIGQAGAAGAGGPGAGPQTAAGGASGGANNGTFGTGGGGGGGGNSGGNAGWGGGAIFGGGGGGGGAASNVAGTGGSTIFGGGGGGGGGNTGGAGGASAYGGAGGASGVAGTVPGGGGGRNAAGAKGRVIVTTFL